MDQSHTNCNQSSDDSTWCFLAEFSIRDFLPDPDRSPETRAGPLFQAVQALRMSPEWAENIEKTLSGLAKKTLVYFNPGELELSRQIRVFCQKKILDDANLTPAALRPWVAEPGLEPVQGILESGKKRNGGWGFFLIERGEDFPPDSSLKPSNRIDLYLYKEGE